jgi:formamidopyrimidine-DNA glycosylase
VPELPEVETIVRGLNRKVVGRKILDVWTDWVKMIKTHKLADFVKEIKGRKILKVRRRHKYIFLDLSGGKTLIIHQKISGHLLYGQWVKQNQNDKSKLKIWEGQKWVPAVPGPLRDDPYNRHIRFILFLDNDWQIALSDLRRFGKVFLGDTEKIEHINEIGKLGPEPLEKRFTFEKFKGLMIKKKGVIKKVLMDPFVIAGIGNIYSDEILWYAGIHPLHRVERLKEPELWAIYKNVGLVLKKAIRARGDSQQDYRTLEGKFGTYQDMEKAYQKTGERCQKKDDGVIERIKVNNRSAHFCPVHQK